MFLEIEKLSLFFPWSVVKFGHFPIGCSSTFANPAVNSRIQFVSVNPRLKKLFFLTGDAALYVYANFQTGQL